VAQPVPGGGKGATAPEPVALGVGASRASIWMAVSPCEAASRLAALGP